MALTDLLKHRLRRPIATLATLAALAGCGGDGGGIVDPPKNKSPGCGSLSAPASAQLSSKLSATLLGCVDPDGSIAGYEFTPAPDSVSGATAFYTASGSSMNLRGRAKDNQGAYSPWVQADVVVTAVPVDNPPVFSSLTGSNSVQTGKVFTLNASGTDDKGLSKLVTYWAANDSTVIPLSGTSFNQSLQYTYNTAGQKNILVIAVDNANQRTEKTHQLVVEAPAYATGTFRINQLISGQPASSGSILLTNGRTVNFNNGTAPLTLNDSTPAGSYRFVIDGSFPKTNIGAQITNGGTFNLGIVDPSFDYTKALTFMYSYGGDQLTHRWNTKPKVFIDDVNVYDGRSGKLVKMQVSPDSLAKLRYTPAEISSIISVFQEDVKQYTSFDNFEIIRASTAGSTQVPDLTQLSPANYPVGWSVHGKRIDLPPNFLIGASDQVVNGEMRSAVLFSKAGVEVARAYYGADIYQSFGPNNQDKEREVVQVSDGRPTQFGKDLGKLFYSVPALSGKKTVNGVTYPLYINN